MGIKNKLSAIPILKDGKLFTNISNSDVKLALSGNNDTMLNMIGENALDFVSKVRTRNVGPKNASSFPAAVVVKETDSFSGVIAKLAATGLHRLYVVDDHHLIGVISLKDVLKVIV